MSERLHRQIRNWIVGEWCEWHGRATPNGSYKELVVIIAFTIANGSSPRTKQSLLDEWFRDRMERTA